MRQGDKVTIKMHKPLHESVKYDKTVYECGLINYDESGECIYLSVNHGELHAFTLDAIYVCEIKSEEELQCTGRIIERSRQKAGNILKMQIENGFYKISLK